MRVLRMSHCFTLVSPFPLALAVFCGCCLCFCLLCFPVFCKCLGGVLFIPPRALDDRQCFTARSARRKKKGVCIEKQLEPSYGLLDLVLQQFEAQQLAYISLDRCTSREWEVAMGKTSKQIQLDTDHLVVREKSDTPDQVAATEMQIYEALHRRDIAYAFADLLEWTVHERYISQLGTFARIRHKVT